MLATDLRLAVRNLRRNRRRAAISLIAVAFGVAALVVALSFVEWILWAARETTIHTQLGHFQVNRQGFREDGSADPFRFVLPPGFERDLGIDRLQGVRVVAPRLMFTGLASFGDTSVAFTGEGIEPQREAAMHRAHRLSRSVNIVKGSDLSAGDAADVILGEGLAAALGVQPGDRLVLLATPRTGNVNAVEVTVKGFFTTISKAFDDSALRVPLGVAQRLLKADGVHSLVVLMDRTDSTSGAIERLAPAAAKAGLEIVPWFAASDFYNKTVALFSRQSMVVMVIIAVLIALGISSIMTISVYERTGEIGTVLALGVARRSVLAQFLIEGTLLGVIGGANGVVLGVLACIALSAVGIPMPPPPGQSWGYTAEMRLTVSNLLQAFALAVAAAAVTALYPAWKASRLPIVDALRANR